MDKAKFGILIDKIENLTQGWQWGKVGQGWIKGASPFLILSFGRENLCKTRV